MLFNFNKCDCSPLVIDNEFEVNNEDLLAEYVGKIVLGHYAHVKRIIKALSTTNLAIHDSDIQSAIDRLKGTSSDKRDGWIFQIISWLALFSENNGKKFYCQQPHDAPAQHGLDGIAILLNDSSTIDSIIITEDKCTGSHRVLIPKVWEEFKQFERGDHDNKLVSRISALIEHLDDGSVLEVNRNNIYLKDIRQYRVGINRNDTYQTEQKRKDLFKGYDECVKDTISHRRYASTLHKEDIRAWMEQFSQKVIKYLESQKSTNV
jgi:hypothetical protein